jgi:hypothetical protein
MKGSSKKYVVYGSEEVVEDDDSVVNMSRLVCMRCMRSAGRVAT